jgi:NAD(P)-dependent dehydrogenase (short-subunit alcohol dehydrogenase family)
VSDEPGTFTAAVHGRCAVVTGGSGGIGSATALALGRAGLFVHVADARLEAAEDVVSRVSEHGGVAMAHHVDLRDPDSIVRLFEAVDSHGVPPDVLVNAAGAITYAPLYELDAQALASMVEVNLSGTFLCIREAARRMRDAGGGRIVNLASTASFVAPRLSATAYSMTKGGVRQLTTAAAAELAPDRILVNAVAPGTTRTDFVQGTLDTAEDEAVAAAKVPLGRVGEPEDVVGAVLFFLSDLSSYVTGQTLLVDGGRTTRSA